MGKINGITLVLAIVALLLSSVAYWRSGGQQDVALMDEKVQQAIDTMRQKQKELEAHTVAFIRSGYEHTEATLLRTRQRLSKLATATYEGTKAEIKQVEKDLVALEHGIVDAVKSVEQSTLDAASKAEQAMAKRTHRLAARVEIIDAEVEIHRANAHANSQEFKKAAQQLDEALGHIEDATRILSGDTAYDGKIDTARRSLEEAAKALAVKAEQTEKMIKKAEADAHALVLTLEAAHKMP